MISELPKPPAPFDTWCDCVLESVQEMHYRVPENAVDYAIRELAALRAERDALRQRIAGAPTVFMPTYWAEFLGNAKVMDDDPRQDVVRVRIVEDPEPPKEPDHA